MESQSYEQPDPTYARLVEQYSKLLQTPAQRLKFLRAALDKYHSNPLAERIGWLKQITFRKTIIEELVRHLPSGVPRPREVSLVFWLYQIRYPVYFTVTLLAVVSTALAVEWVYGTAREAGLFDLRLQRPQDARTAPPEPVKNTPVSVPQTVNAAQEDNTAVEGFTPDKIWMVERTEDFEQYSNGGRILINYETSSEPRSFYALRRKPTRSSATPPVSANHAVYYPELFDHPVGILYHVTQSDILPFLPRNNQTIKGNTEQLLEYVRQEKLYNYLIDRFGRIYRVVRDEDYANHSGNSIWSDDTSVYLNLNHSFIGISFEGRWSSDIKFNPDEINEAQLYAGKVLTEILRSKYKIQDANCVTHGLVSINPTEYLIGHHLDWATGFPFSKLGLNDKYLQLTPSIAEFGFRYDRAFTTALGNELWPGIVLAEARLKAQAADKGLSAGLYRRQLQNDFKLYRQWLHEMREQAKAAGKGTSSEPGDEIKSEKLLGIEKN
jgi:hypothetical protein